MSINDSIEPSIIEADFDLTLFKKKQKREFENCGTTLSTDRV